MGQLENMKSKIGIDMGDTSQDALLTNCLNDAEELILDYTHLDTVPTRLLRTQVELAIIAYNKLGNEGQKSYSEGGISISFEDVPESIYKKLRAFRVLPKVVKTNEAEAETS